MLKLVSNKIRCKFCGDVIESFTVHDFKRCRCGKCSTDGGLEYAQRSFFTDNPEDTYEDLSLYVDENGKLVKAQDADKKDIPLKPVHVEVEKVPVVIPKEDGTHEIKEVEAVPVTPEIFEAEAEIEEGPGPDVEIKDFNDWTYETTMKEEPKKEEEVVVKRDKNGKPISGRYPYGNKK